MSDGEKHAVHRIVGTATTRDEQQSLSLSPASSSASSSSASTTTTRTFPFDPWYRKPLAFISEHDNNNHHHHHHHSAAASSSLLQRHLSVWDLLSIGVGGTVGSGIFVLIGQLAVTHAGQAVWCSFAIGGMAATASGLCFAELSARLPVDGSTYVYAYACWGQGAAVVAAACLTLEYAVAGAAVARTWGDKLIRLLVLTTMAGTEEEEEDSRSMVSSEWLLFLLQPWGVFNMPAGAVSAASTWLLLSSVRTSKHVTNFMTLVKMILVAFMILGGFWLSWWPTTGSTSTANEYNDTTTATTAWAPYGVAGILRGATSSFFGYLGYDEVCCVAGEARHPVRDMPRAVLGTLAIVTVTYVAASLALTGMVDDPTTQLSPTSGFPSAFSFQHVEWAALVAAWGEVVTLPLVVLISLLAQPRLTFSMAQDGLLPARFAATHADTGNLTTGTTIAGTAMTIIATCVPFTYLDDLISAGILVAFCLTNSSLVLLRRDSPIHRTGLLEQCLLLYNAMCLASALLWTHRGVFPGQMVVAVLTLLVTILCVPYMAVSCPPAQTFGGSVLQWNGRHHPTATAAAPTHISQHDQHEYFQTPWVPFLPCFAMAINWYLIAQLEVIGLLLLVSYLGVAFGLYYYSCCYCCGAGSPNAIASWSRVSHSYESLDVQDENFIGTSSRNNNERLKSGGDGIISNGATVATSTTIINKNKLATMGISYTTTAVDDEQDDDNASINGIPMTERNKIS